MPFKKQNTFKYLNFKKFTIISILFFCFGYFFSNSAFAEKLEDLKYSGYVNDFADVLTTDEENSISKKISDLEKATGNEIAVVTVHNMSGDYIEHFAYKLFENWGIGKKKEDNGLLFLIVIDDRKMRMEVGYGLEPVLTDGVTKYIQDNVVSPEFKNSNYYSGIKLGVDSIVSAIGGERVSESSGVYNSLNSNNIFKFLSEVFPFLIFFFFGFLQWIISVMSRTKSWWLGGVIGAGIGLGFILGFSLSIFTEIALLVLTALGLFIDYLVSKDYKNKLSNFDIDNPPSWWAGSTWGPGGSTWTSSSGSFGGFGGGSSGGGGSNSDW